MIRVLLAAAVAALGAAACSPVGTVEQALALAPVDADMAAALDIAGARLQRASGIGLYPSSLGLPLRWGEFDGPAAAGCRTELVLRNGVHAPKSIVCRPRMRDQFPDPRDLALSVLHESIHALSPNRQWYEGLRAGGAPEHPACGSVMAAAPKGVAAEIPLNSCDLDWLCQDAGCDIFNPEEP